MSVPAVSVLMPAYNAAPFVKSAVVSILAQTFTDLELIVIDDGSTDGTRELLRQITDPRLVLIELAENGGYTHALNIAIERARGEILVRQDADDLSRPGRVAAQVDAFTRNDRLAIVGSDVELIDATGEPLRIDRQPRSDAEIRVRALFQNPFVHSSVAFRTRDIRTLGHAYDPTLEPSEDYGLWSELLALGEGCNLPAPLVAYRVHASQVSSTRADRQEAAATEVARRNLAALGLIVGNEDVTAARHLAQGFPQFLDAPQRSAARTILEASRRLATHSGADLRDETRRLARRLTVAAPRSVVRDRRLLASVMRLDPLAPLAPFGKAVRP